MALAWSAHLTAWATRPSCRELALASANRGNPADHPFDQEEPDTKGQHQHGQNDIHDAPAKASRLGPRLRQGLLRAAAAPLAVRSVRRTLRGGLGTAVRDALAHERDEQLQLMATADFAEGVAATAERRTPVFTAT